MQSLDDDMEDLFRRAGEDYPLKTDGFNWKKVQQKISIDEGNSIAIKKQDYRAFWLLLLLPFAFICGRYTEKNSPANKKVEVSNNRSSKANIEAVITSKYKMGNTIVEKRKAAPFKAHNYQSKSADGRPGKSNANNHAAANSIQAANELNKISPFLQFEQANKAGGLLAGEPPPFVSKMDLRKQGSLPQSAVVVAEMNLRKQGSLPQSAVVVAEMDLRKQGSLPQSAVVVAEMNLRKHGASQTGFSPVTKMDLLQTGALPSGQLNVQTANDMVIEKGAAKQVLSVDTAPTAALLKTPEMAVENLIGNVNKPPIKEPVKKGWYYGVTVAPDITTIKFKQANKLGYSVGILLGYQTGKRLRVETGLLWSTKNYFTDGKYLDTANLSLPLHSKVLQANGSCNMFEIPLAIQYNVYSKAKRSVFVAAGIHSYLMKREQYDISYKRYNVNYAANYLYANSTENWFSVAGFSAGYRTAFGKQGFVTFAPYIKLPLIGLGVGKLPMLSTGLNITAGNFLR